VNDQSTHGGKLNPDRLAIREVVENWVIWRDSADWERFATVWHDDGWMTATWFQGAAREFITASREAFERGVNILHVLGGGSCDVSAGRAIAQTRMTILQRAPLEGVAVDVSCFGRFYDFFERRAGRWAIVRRQPIYEKDRLDVVDPSARVTLDAALLSRFPEGYRHLAYVQTKNGFNVKHGLPGLRGAAVEKLYEEGRAWLAGTASPGDVTPCNNV
jgi:SnoaL-like domain